MLFAPPAKADTQLSLREHMAAMGYLMDEVWVKVAEPKDYAAAVVQHHADGTANRTHHRIQMQRTPAEATAHDRAP